MTDTPETSEAWAAVSRTPNGMYDSSIAMRQFAFAMCDHSEKMERERDQWIAKAAELSAERESNAMQASAFKAERDEARRLAEKFASGHDVIFYWQNSGIK